MIAGTVVTLRNNVFAWYIKHVTARAEHWMSVLKLSNTEQVVISALPMRYTIPTLFSGCDFSSAAAFAVQP